MSLCRSFLITHLLRQPFDLVLWADEGALFPLLHFSYRHGIHLLND